MSARASLAGTAAPASATAARPEALGVDVEHLSKRFSHAVKGTVYAAHDVSVAVAPGEFLTLLGPSGCGKTTTLRMIAGFETPDAGRIAFGGQDVTRLPANQRGIGFVFQNYALFPHLSVAENVAYGLRVRGSADAEISSSVAEVLRLVGLAGYERQFPAQMSGGEQQRVALARAIVIRPRVLLFDEPLSNLDARLRVQMRDEIRALQQRLAITAVYVTHDQEEAMAVSDRIAVMQGGRIVQTGSAEDLYHRPATRFVAEFIGRANLIEARVEGTAGDGLEVSARGRRGVLADAGPGPKPAVGDRVVLLLRPERIGLAARTTETPGPEARIVSRVFLGEKIDYGVACAGQTLQVVRYDAGARGLFAVGQAVSIDFDDDAAVRIVDAEGAATRTSSP